MGGARRARRATWLPVLILVPASVVSTAASSQALELRSADASSESPGRIDGRVLDAETGRALTGASVVLTGAGRQTVAGVGGRFSIRDVAPGERAIQVSFLGYASKVVTNVVVEAGKPVWIEIVLAPAAVELEAIRVNAARVVGSVGQTTGAQRAASAVVNAIGAEQISRSPDGVAADAIRRVSGVSVQDGKYVFVRGLGERYTTASLNGARIPSSEPERRVVPLDLFPAGLLQTITTTKTFTPDQAGDFTGARVDIRTREFPAGREISFSMSTEYHPEITGRSMLTAPSESGDWLAMGASARQIPPSADRFVSSSRGAEVNEVVNSFRNRWSVSERSASPSASFAVSVGGQDELAGRDIGYLLSGTYSAGPEAAFDQRRAMAGAEGTEFNRYDGSSGGYGVLWGGLANLSTYFGSHTHVALNNTYNRSADNEARIEVGTDEDTSARVRIERLQYVERAVRSNQLHMEHQLHARHRVHWAVTSAGVVRHEPDRSEYVTWLDPEVPTWFKHEEGAVRSFGRLDESSLEGSLDYEWQVGVGAYPHRIHVGGLVRTVERAAHSQAFRLQPFDWSEDDPRWQAPPETIFDGRYAGEDDALFLLGRDRSGGSYSAGDRLHAGYIMADVALGQRVRLVGGARIEHSALELQYESQVGNVGSAEPEYTDVLPSLALNVDLADDHKLRLSVSRTLARPEYREVAPIAYREVLGGEQIIGNPELRRTLIQNYDVRWEWYPAYAEVLSIGLFAKRFADPIEQRFLARSGTDTRTFENAESAVNYGVEVEAVRNLGFLADRLKTFSAFANVTLIRSEVKTGRDDDGARAMVGQAPYVVNGGLTYAPRGSELTATVLYNVVGPRIVNARASGSQVADVVEAPRPGLDLSVRMPFLAGTAAKLDLRNLLDAPYEIQQGSVVRAYHRTGRSLSLGLSWRH
jgi:hypothetical protein